MNNQENQPKSSFAVLPSYIMDDENLDEGAKILYARISMYSNEGRCWASNTHLAQKQNVTTRCIQKWLKQLVDRKYIEIELEKGFQTKRNIWLVFDFKNNLTRRTTVHPPTNYSSPPHELQFTHINTSNININPPPLPPPKIERPEIPKKEEEDFLNLLSFLNLSANQLDKLRRYSLDQLRHALEIFKTQKVKKSKIGLLLDILDNPQRWEIPLEEQFTQNQLLALQHNEFLKKHITEEAYEKNVISIKRDFYLNLFLGNGQWSTTTCKDTMTEEMLKQDIKESERIAKLLAARKKK